MKHIDNKIVLDLIFIVILFVCVSKCDRNNNCHLVMIVVGIIYIMYALGLIQV